MKKMIAHLIKYLNLLKPTTLLKSALIPLEIYTDGSVKRGRGAWAFVVVQEGVNIFEASGFCAKTDSNHMELQAAIEALKWLLKPTQAIIYSDSRLLIDSLTLWIPAWKRNGWLKKRGWPNPKNPQFHILDALNQQHTISWRWIRAHAGNVHNERCDELCIKARE